MERYQEDFISYVHERLKVDSLDEPANTDALPEFSYREKGVSEVLQINSTALLFLVLYATLFFLGAYVSFLKCDVR